MRFLSQLTKLIKNGALIGGVGIGLFFNYHVNYLLSSSGQISTSLLTTRWVTDLVTLGLLLGVIEAYDQRVTRLRGSRGEHFPLDRAGIAQINEELEINTEILHEDDREEVFVSLPEPTHTHLTDQLRDAFELHQAMPQSRLTIVADAGHSTTEYGISRALIQALSRMRQIFA